MISRNKDTQSGTFLSLSSENKLYNIKFTRLVTEAFCNASSQRYLIMANRDGNFIFNPFSKTQITLPKQYVPLVDAKRSMCGDDFRSYFCKAILSSSPTIAGISQCVIAASGRNTHIVEMCRLQDSEWSVFGAVKEEINNAEEVKVEEYLFSDDDVYDEADTDVGNQLHLEEQLEEDGWLFHDLLFYKGMLYGLTRANILVSFEFVDSSKPLGYRALNMLPMNTHTPEEDTVYTNYLVESSGELLMVYRCRNIINDGIRVQLPL